MRSFESWTLEDLGISFGLKEVRKSELLTNWLSSKIKIEADKEKFMLHYQELLIKYNKTWNEDELKLQFIAPFLMLIDFNSDHYKSFSQRTLSAKINDIEVSGKVDLMVATGLNKPKIPYFFLHEFKPARKVTNDPDGQLIIAMLSAQTLNNDNKPMYGVVIEGRYWYFVVLQDKQYIISQSFDATKDDIYEIYSILCKAKEYIELRVTN